MYNSAVTEPPKRRALADDDDFLERLSELDAGLTADEADGAPADGRRTESSDLPPCITAPFDALPKNAPPSPPQLESEAEPRRRPLLDLFPPEPVRSQPRPSPVPRPPALRIAGPAQAIVRAAPRERDLSAGVPENAFGNAPDPRFFFHSTPHDAVVQELLTAIRRRDGLVLLTGCEGVGKTVVCRVVLDQIDRRTVTSLLSDGIVSGEQLLARILADFGVMSDAAGGLRSVPELRAALHSFVDSLGPLDASAVVVVDDAEKLPAAVFDEVRALCEAAHVSSRLQVVVVGGDGLAALLRRRENRALHQRIAVRCTLEPLPAEEVVDYVVHRMAVAGRDPIEFEESAADRLFAFSRGVPRLINRIASRAIELARERSSGMITKPIVDAAAADAGVRHGAAATIVRRIAAAALFIAFLIIGAAAAAWVFRDSVARAIAVWRLTPAAPDPPPRQRLPAPLRVPPVPDGEFILHP